MSMSIGVDVGNYDTKTQHTTMPSGFSVYAAKPRLDKDYLFYEGRYYLPSMTRIEYVKDKTENDQCLILTLFGIAREIIYQANDKLAKDGIKEPSDKDLQEYADEIRIIKLGVGLPVGDFSILEPKTKQYYVDRLSGGVEFTYRDISFNLSVEKCVVFPQDILPVCGNPECGIVNDYSKYVIIGIGGQTVDIVPIIGGKPAVDKCISDRRGVRNMFSGIIGMLDNNFGTTIGEDTVDDVLRGRKTPLPDEMVQAINNYAENHAGELLNICATKNINFIEYPVVFFGGGSLLLRPFLEECQQLKKFEFIEDVNGNAKYYASYAGK